MFTRVELTDWNTPRLFLMFYIHLHLLSIAFWKLWFNLTMESFKSSCIWKHPLFCWWFSSKTEVKNDDYYVQIFLFYLLIFSHWFLKSNQISSGIIFFFFTHFMKATFSQVRHPSHPGHGCGSLTCHMTHFEQSDWLRSPNLTNIMIEYLIHTLYKITELKVSVEWLSCKMVKLRKLTKTNLIGYFKEKLN